MTEGPFPQGPRFFDPAPPSGDALPALPPLPMERSLVARAVSWLRGYFLDQDPSFLSAFAPQLLASLVLFTRWPATNYIFDEQEALLANPYVNAASGLRFGDAIHRDFWGLPPERSIGSYRPIPDLLWRALWAISKQPFFHHVYNVVFHALNAALLTGIVFAWTRRRGTAYLAGFLFVACAVLTEAVSGIVGIADVLGGMGALLALAALTLPAWAMPFAVFMSVSFGLFCKESALVCVPLVPFAALLGAPLTHPGRPARLVRALLAFASAAAAFVLYVELRKKWFPSPLPAELTIEPPPDAPLLKRAFFEFLVWFHQAPLPKDPLNNPLVDADAAHRVAGALRVYWRGLGQLVYPGTLSGDYSYPQEPIPESLVFPESVAGAACMVVPPFASVGLWVAALLAERKARRAAGSRAEAARWGSQADPYRLFSPPSVPPEGADVATSQAARALKRVAGLLLLLVALAQLALELLVLAPRGHLYAFRGVPWIATAPLLGLLGLGLLVEGLGLLPSPDPPGAPVPLGRAGPVLVAIGLTWVVVSFFPHSNIAMLLPTVRAERFWYFPAIGSSLALAVGLSAFAAGERRAALGEGAEGRWLRVAGVLLHVALVGLLCAGVLIAPWYVRLFRTLLALAVAGSLWASVRTRSARASGDAFAAPVPWLTVTLATAFFLFQGVQAYRHATDYRDDVSFWGATKDAVPYSAKAHLNYSVMKGARGDLATRLDESRKALALAPKWAMAHVYTGDTLCRLHRADEAWPYYKEGFDIGPNDLSLIALALQCLYDEDKLKDHDAELRALADEHEGSWIAYLATDTLANSEKNKGVDPKYRPRGYNEGPKE